MKKLLFVIVMMIVCGVAVAGRKVTVAAVNQPAASVFRTLIVQTGMNFVYSSDILEGVYVTVNVRNKPIRKVLEEMFRDTGIEYRIKGQDVILRRRPVSAAGKTSRADAGRIEPRRRHRSRTVMTPKQLDEVVVVSRLESPAVESAEVGAKKLTAEEITSTPSLLGEADVLKALSFQPGVVSAGEGMAAMHVHGGNADENLCMLDNVPLYQVNHFGGFFSSFNPDVIRYVDFFKSSVPAKYDGRLSSFLDVRLYDNIPDSLSGTAKLGLTSGGVSLRGPIGKRTGYVVGLRRSWADLLTMPLVAIANSSQDEKIRAHYSFMDLNAKLIHRFEGGSKLFFNVYFGNDLLKTGTKEIYEYGSWESEDEKIDFHWGNFVAQAGLSHRFSRSLTAEFTAAHTRFFSRMSYSDINVYVNEGDTMRTSERSQTRNSINDWIFRGDAYWRPAEWSHVRFGTSYTRHSFLPQRVRRETSVDDSHYLDRDSTSRYGADEFSVYAEDDMTVSEKIRLNGGLHLTLFNIGGSVRGGVSPRLSFSYRPSDNWAFKGAYTRTTQFVHLLARSYLSLPTDQWIPVMGDFRPQTADKIAVGAYHQLPSLGLGISVEAYWKWMNNLIDYLDEYYLYPPSEEWNARLTSGRGTAKGIDLKVERTMGRVTGHVSYSLAWADRTFKEKNGGMTFPARFDNRHTINILLNWKISDKVGLNAAWTGHSGNRFTLMPQVWESPDFGGSDYYGGDVALRAPLNNYRLPFYHRLDLSLTVRNRRGYWTFGLYNAYNHLNTVSIRRGSKKEYPYDPVFQKVAVLPMIPSVSYTWQF